MIRRLTSGLIVATLLAGSFASPALSASVDDKIEKLEAQVKMLMGEIEALKEARKADQEQAANLNTEIQKLSELEPAAGSGVKVTMSPSPKVESADGQYSFQPFGRMHLDYTVFDDDLHNHPDNSDWRRARFGFKGKLGEDWKYKYEMDLADESVGFDDVYLRYTGVDDVDLTIGHFKPFQGFQELTSSNYISLTERSAPINLFARSYTTGLAAETHGDMWSAHIGLFGEPAGSTSDNDDENTSIAARLTAAPVNDDAKLLHIGVSSSIREMRNGNMLSLSSRGETGEGDNLISTGTIFNVDRTMVHGLELAGTLGSLHTQAEYLMMDVSRSGGMTDADFDGWYAQAGYILTGEHRPYSVSSGSFKRIKPMHPFNLESDGWGAWEMVGRFSNADLNDTGAGITGGEMDIWSLGLNWYLNNHVRLMANYRNADTDANGVVPNDNPQSFTIRTQFDF